MKEAMQTPLEDLMNSDIELYEKGASAIHYYSSTIPKAIKEYWEKRMATHKKNITDKKLKDVYKEALRLHRISFNNRQKIKGLFNFKKFDDSHLPLKYNDPREWDRIDKKIDCNISYEKCDAGVFICELTFNEALILLIRPHYHNIHYRNEVDIDLSNYHVGANTFRIEIV